MRILFLTNYYPPHEVGGYEQLCRDVATRLAERGHAIVVLTSDRGIDKRAHRAEPGIHRLLRIQPQWHARIGPAAQSFFIRRRIEESNRQTLRTIAQQFRPDAVFVWNLQGLPYELALDAEALPGVAVAYWLAGYSPAEPDTFWQYWTQPPRERPHLGRAKALVRRTALAQMRREGKPVRPEMRHVAVVSEYMRRRGLAENTVPAHARIIYNGVELDRFHAHTSSANGALRLLFAGRVSEDKGVHTAIEAMRIVVKAVADPKLHLTVVGSGPDDYRRSLAEYIDRHGLADFVTLGNWVSRDKMPQLFAHADVLLLPSIYPEALPRVVLEAMACGLAVVATPAGGTGEIVEHEVTGLLFAAGDGADLARQIMRLLADPELRGRLGAEAHRCTVARFSMERMVDDMEAFLAEAVAGPKGGARSALGAGPLPEKTAAGP